MTGGQLKPTTPNLSTWSRGQRAGHTAHTAWKRNGMKAVAAATAAAAQTSLFFFIGSSDQNPEMVPSTKDGVFSPQ